MADFSTQICSMTKAVKSLQLILQPPSCDCDEVWSMPMRTLYRSMSKCGGPHVEDVNYIGDNRQGHNQGPQYNQQNWRPQQSNWNQAGPSNSAGNQWRSNTQPPGFEKKPSSDDQVAQIYSFMTKSQKENEHFKEKINEKFGHIDVIMKNLEMMIGQLATAAQTRPQGAIPSTTITNPKVNEQCKAVTLRSGKEIERLGEQVHSGPNILQAGADKLLGSQTSHARGDEGSEWAIAEARDGRQEKASWRDTKKKKSLSPTMDPKSLFNFPDCIPPPPFPIEKKNRKKIIQEKGLDWMMNIIRKVNVDVSLVDLFLHFPKFSKFFKDLIAKKEKIQDDGVVILSAFCSQFVKGKSRPHFAKDSKLGLS